MANAERRRSIYWLLALPYAVILLVGFYNRAAPPILGIPFFYWFQLLLIPISSVLIAVVYKAARQTDKQAKD